MSDLIDRQKLIEFLQERFKLYDWDDGGAEKAECGTIIREIYDFPSAEMQSFEWCHDCKEYDQEAHCCHRFSKVINKTVEEIKESHQREWIPCSERLPEVGTYLVTTSKGKVCLAYWQNIWHPKTNHKNIVAWMPLPEPYKVLK